jgi:tRNA threonylcarbamoyladenosine biosynthesis protein TsaE
MSVVRDWKNIFETDLEQVVVELKESLPAPCAIILSGPVGAGKTTLTKKFIGGEQEVCSPTYSIINESENCAHADFYRLKSPEEVVHLELDLYLEDKDFFLIEWGKEFLKEIRRNIESDWRLFELEIEINPKNSDESTTSSRNLILSEIK